MRFVEPVTGTVPINGVDIRDLRGDDVRRLVGLCAQDAYLFDSTLAENVRLARPDATDDEISAVLERVGLGPWVQSLPDRLGTWIGEQPGSRLSGGQRQRLSVARVLLAAQPIVILDEPTEHLDEAGAAALLADLLESTRGAILLVMTHRRRDLQFVDSVVDLAEFVPTIAEPPRIDSRTGN